VLALAGAGSASKSGSPAAWISWAKIALGVLLLMVAAREFRARPRGNERPQMAKWMATIDKTTPVATLGLAALLSGANPKNLLLAVGGAAAIAQAVIMRSADPRVGRACGDGPDLERVPRMRRQVCDLRIRVARSEGLEPPTF
jgi:Sap, sulfolipid-1-addressing protein